MDTENLKGKQINIIPFISITWRIMTHNRIVWSRGREASDNMTISKKVRDATHDHTLKVIGQMQRRHQGRMMDQGSGSKPILMPRLVQLGRLCMLCFFFFFFCLVVFYLFNDEIGSQKSHRNIIMIKAPFFSFIFFFAFNYPILNGDWGAEEATPFLYNHYLFIYL